MTLVKYRNGVPSAFNNFMDDFFTTLPSLYQQGLHNKNGQQFPAVNVIETEEAYQLDVVAPGFEKEQFSVQMEDKLLTISAEAAGEQKAEAGKTIRREFVQKGFKRSFTLDDNIDGEGISAKYVNGVLAVNLPKRKDVKEEKKQITIQ